MTVFVALLKAVNVGGTGKLPMAAFKKACEAAGLGNVSTYIASGNLVCTSKESAVAVRDLIASILRDRFGLPNHPVLIRSAASLAEAIERNPFADAAAERPNLLQVHFLEDTPATDALDGLPGPERVHLDGQHLYVDYVAGIGRSKLTQTVLERKLRVILTGRNWNTVRKLFDMAQAAP